MENGKKTIEILWKNDKHLRKKPETKKNPHKQTKSKQKKNPHTQNTRNFQAR